MIPACLVEFCSLALTPYGTATTLPSSLVHRAFMLRRIRPVATADHLSPAALHQIGRLSADHCGAANAVLPAQCAVVWRSRCCLLLRRRPCGCGCAPRRTQRFHHGLAGLDQSPLHRGPVFDNYAPTIAGPVPANRPVPDPPLPAPAPWCWIRVLEPGRPTTEFANRYSSAQTALILAPDHFVNNACIRLDDMKEFYV